MSPLRNDFAVNLLPWKCKNRLRWIGVLEKMAHGEARMPGVPLQGGQKDHIGGLIGQFLCPVGCFLFSVLLKRYILQPFETWFFFSTK